MLAAVFSDILVVLDGAVWMLDSIRQTCLPLLVLTFIKAIVLSLRLGVSQLGVHRNKAVYRLQCFR